MVDKNYILDSDGNAVECSDFLAWGSWMKKKW